MITAHESKSGYRQIMLDYLLPSKECESLVTEDQQHMTLLAAGRRLKQTKQAGDR